MYSLNKSILAILACLLPLTLRAETTTITAIQNWHHPTKQVFLSYGIQIQKVCLVNKTYPEFYLYLPQVARVLDKEQFEIMVRKVAQKNGYWDFAIIDEIQKIKVRVKCSRAHKKVALIDYLSGATKFQDPTLRYQRSIETPFGKVVVFDISPTLDTNRYCVLRGDSKKTIDEGEYRLEKVELLSVGTPYRSYLFLTFFGPGMHCHEHYRLVEVTPLHLVVSDPFGTCSELRDAQSKGDTLVVYLTTTSGVESVTWVDGHLGSGK